MTSFYQFLIWFFTIISLLVLMYGVLSADIVFVGLAVCTFIMSVIFYRINEVSPSDEVKEDRVRDLILDGVDHENFEMMSAINSLKQEQTKLLTSYKKAVYENEEILNTVSIKKDIIRKFISSLSINYEMVSKQELKELLFKLLNEFVKKNSNYLFEPNFFPSEIHEYSNWVRQSLVLLGWNVKSGDEAIKQVFFEIFEKSGMVIAISVFTNVSGIKIVIKQHEYYLEQGIIDFSVIVCPNFKDEKNQKLSQRVLLINHSDLPKLSSFLQNLISS